MLHVEPQQSWLAPPQAAQVDGTVPKLQVLPAGEHAGLLAQQREPIAVPQAWQVPDVPAEVLQAMRGVMEVLHCSPDVQQGWFRTPQPWHVLDASQMSPAVLQSGVSQQCLLCVPQLLLQVAPVQYRPGALPHQLPGQQAAPLELPQLLLQVFVPGSQTRPVLQAAPVVQQAEPTPCPQNENEPWEPEAEQSTSAP